MNIFYDINPKQIIHIYSAPLTLRSRALYMMLFLLRSDAVRSNSSNFISLRSGFVQVNG